MDREGDIFELLAARRDEGGIELLVRAQHDRSLVDGGNLFKLLRGSPERARMEIPLERLSARNSARGQSASPGRAKRVASAALRWTELDLPVPEKRRGEFGACPCRMRVVHVLEDRPPEGAEPLEWTLLTTLPVGTEAEAREVLRWYRLRWRIDNFPSLCPYSVRRSVSDAIRKSGTGLPAFSGPGVSRHLRMEAIVPLSA